MNGGVEIVKGSAEIFGYVLLDVIVLVKLKIAELVVLAFNLVEFESAVNSITTSLLGVLSVVAIAIRIKMMIKNIKKGKDDDALGDIEGIKEAIKDRKKDN